MKSYAAVVASGTKSPINSDSISREVQSVPRDLELDSAAQFLSQEELDLIRCALQTADDKCEEELERNESVVNKEATAANVVESTEGLPIRHSSQGSDGGGNTTFNLTEKQDEIAGISEEDLAAIERAIREADDAEEARSMQLALRMQEEEQRWQQQRQRPLSSHRLNQQGHVKTMTLAELHAEQTANEAIYSNVSPKFSGDDVRVDFLQRPILVDSDDVEDELPLPAGFRMNSTTEHQWSRFDLQSNANRDMRTKHDRALDSQANMHRLGLEQDVSSIGNRTFNSFRQSMKRKTKKGVATHGTGRAGSDSDGIKGGALDAAALEHITKAINAGWINKLNGVVKEGKEAVIYHADQGEESGGFDVAVKIFKRIQEFRNRGDYVDGDPRFDGNSFQNATKRQQLRLWTEKEYRNLVRASRAGVPVPTPLLCKDNLLFMRFLGTQGWPAPQIREVELRKGGKTWDTLYQQVLGAIRNLYVKARLVHGDLSEYNIMVVPAFLVENMALSIENPPSTELQAVLIDFGQAVDIRHDDARNLLERDLDRVASFFNRQGVTTKSAVEALKFVVDVE